MATETWAEGYVAEIPYSLGFYRETTPAHLCFTALSLGRHPGPAAAPSIVLELGIGMGLSIVLSAATHPGTHFEGVDFNPLHIAHAQGLANAAALENLRIREASFQQLAGEADEGQHDLDLILLHGILSWVSADAHAAIIEIARKRLKPGGLLYVSYNCMPGWAPMLPVQRLMREHAGRVAGRADVRAASALDLLGALGAEGGGYLKSNPDIVARLAKVAGMDRNYLAHEYLNANWFIFHFADVAAMFAEAKLEFLGSATLAENLDAVSVPEGARARIASEADPIFRETLRDFASNKQFRRDLFGRGIRDLNVAESRGLLGPMRFNLAVPREEVSFAIPTNIGELQGRPDLYGAVANLLAAGPASFEQIAALPAFSAIGSPAALQTLALLVHSGQVLPLSGRDGQVDPAPAHRLNGALAEKARQGRFYNFLAAPEAGSGVPVGQIELLLFAALRETGKEDPGALAAAVQASMRTLGIHPMREKAPVTDPAEQISLLTRDAETLLTGKLQLWRQLRVL